MTQEAAEHPPHNVPFLWRMMLWMGSLVLSAVLILGLAFTAAVVLLKDRPLTAPAWLQARIEARLAETVKNATVVFGDIQVLVEDGWTPRLMVRDVAVMNADGVELLRLNELRATFAAAPLLDGLVQPKDISLSGIFAKLQRTAEGTVAVSVGAAPVAAATRAASLPELIGRMDGILENSQLAALESVDLRALTLRYEDLGVNKAWTVDGGRMRLERIGDTLALSADLAVLGGGASVATLAANYSSVIGETEAKFGVSFDDVDARDIAVQSPAFAWLDIVRAPISGSVRSGLLTDGTFAPLNATLQIGAGVIQPNAQTTPIPFDGLRSYFSYAPQDKVLEFDELSVESAWFTGTVEGTAALGLTQDRRTLMDLVAQISLRDLTVNPNGLYETPVDLSGADAEFRVFFNPFRVDLGRLQIDDQGQTLVLQGHLQAGEDGWDVAVDGQMDSVAPKRVLALWPRGVVEKTRVWLNANLKSGDLSNINLAVRRGQGRKSATFVGFDFADAEVSFLRQMPPVKQGEGRFTLSENRLVVALDAGFVTPPQGGAIDVSGSAFILPDIGIRDGPPSVIRLETRSSATAALSLLNQDPLRVMDKTGLPVALVEGRAVMEGTLAVPLKRGSGFSKLVYHMTGTLSDVRSDTLVKGRLLTSDRLRVVANNQSVEIGGPGLLDDIPFDGTWRQPIGAGSAKSALRGDVVLSQTALDRFGVTLPENTVSGTAPAAIALDFERGTAPRFALTSGLQGIGLRVPQIGWSKPAQSAATLKVAGTLGPVPVVDTLSLDAAGLEAEGEVRLNSDASLERVRFNRLRIGAWLTAAVDLIGRGAGNAVQIVLRGGALDLRAMGDTGAGSGTSSSGGAAPTSPPMRVALDQLVITDTISLTDLQGTFGTRAGLDGEFEARLNGGTPVQGRVVPQAGRSAVRLVSNDAGGVLRSAQLLKQIEGGQMELILSPVGTQGAFDGQLKVTDVRVQNAPGIAGLVNAVSVVGLINELNGDGIYFQDVEANFGLTPNRLTLREGSAVGASLGLSMDGVFALDTGQMAMQGVISPVFLLNGIGAVLTRKGEGVFGFNYQLTGNAKTPSVSVNPLSGLAPGFLRDVLRTTPRPATTPPVTSPLSEPEQSPAEKPLVQDFEGR